MSFTPAKGKWANEKLPTKASVTYTAGMMGYSDATDTIPTADAAQQNIKGIMLEDKANDSTTTSISYRAPREVGCTFIADVDSGETITKADEGDQFDFSSGGLTISTASTTDAVTLVRFISAQKGEFRLNYTTGIEN